MLQQILGLEIHRAVSLIGPIVAMAKTTPQRRLRCLFSELPHLNQVLN